MPHTQKTPLAENFDAWDGTEDTLGAAPGYLWGIDLYNHDCFWEAHEEWEQLWKAATAPSTARYYLQGLIQCAAASLKGVHGNWGPCQTLGTRGLAKLSLVLEAQGDRYQGLDLRQFSENFRAYCSAKSSTKAPPKILLAQGPPDEMVR